MHGRADEVFAIDAVLAAAREGRAAVLELVGEPGIGKTALCGYAATAPGFRVLRALGVQGEADLPLAGLDEVLRPLAADATDLPPVQRTAVGTLLDGAGSAADRYVLGAATLALLARAAETRPLLLVLDDTHWFDEVSGAVLSFALRRLGADAVAVLLVRRPTHRRPVEGPWPQRSIGGLGRADTGALLGPGTAEAVCDRLHAATGGNPLALVELAQALDADQLAGRAELPDPLPLSDRGTAAFGWRLTGLPERTRRALVLVAAAGPGSAELVGRALAENGLDSADLEPAETAGLLEVRGGRPGFPHPLVRAAAFAQATVPQRRAAHRALAAVSAEGDVQRHALHLASAAVAASEEVAAVLERAAEDAERRGGPAAGATARTKAAALSPDGPRRTTRRLVAARACLLTGRREDAAGLIEDVLARGRPGADRWEALALRASAAAWAGDVGGSTAALRNAIAELAEPAPDLAALVAIQLAVVLMSVGGVRETLTVTGQACGLAFTDPVVRYLVEHRHATARAWSGERHAFGEANGRFPLATYAEQARARFPMHDQMTGQALMLSEEFAPARGVVREEVRAARASAAPSRLPMPLVQSADLAFHTDDMLRARADADEVIELGTQVGLGGLGGFAHALSARAAAVEGDEQAVRRHAREAGSVAEDRGQQAVLAYVGHALGLLELISGRPVEAVRHLSEVREISRRTGVGNPVAVPWQGDLVEALHRAGRAGEAARALDELDATVARTGSRWARAAANRCRALLGDPSWAELYESALAEQEDLPFERGRTLLAHGAALRRARQVHPARVALAAAAEQFERIGAHAWAVGARSELRAAGVRTTPAAGRHAALTGQELRVCLAVADGATNREVAAALFLSPKTVEHHLGRAFGKLGVHNRAQLARLVAEHGLRPLPASGEESRPRREATLDSG